MSEELKQAKDIISDLKVDREDNFYPSGLRHLIICVLLGYLALNFV